MKKFNSDSIRFIPNNKIACVDFKQGKSSTEGTNYIALYNQNKKGIDVSVKIASLKFIEVWDTRSVKKYKIETTYTPYLKE